MVFALFAVASGCTPTPKYCTGRVKDSPSIPASNREKSIHAGKTIRLLPPLRNLDHSRINSGFGLRTHPVYQTTEFHSGIDISGHVGEEVFSSASGSIVFSGKQHGYGKVIIIDHGDRFYTVYAHLSYIAAKKGGLVKAGQLIGKIGLTGNSTGAHLHFEVRKKDKAVNPMDYLKI